MPKIYCLRNTRCATPGDGPSRALVAGRSYDVDDKAARTLLALKKACLPQDAPGKARKSKAADNADDAGGLSTDNASALVSGK